MTDRYLFAKDRGKSPEQVDCNVWTIQSVEELSGGAGNVAVNVGELGQSYLALGRMPFPIKNRIIVDGKQVARFDQKDRCQPVELETIKQGLRLCDAVIVSDYGKGAITDEVRQTIIEFGGDKPIFVDSKGSPEVWGAQVYDDISPIWFFPNALEYASHRDAYDRASQVVLKRGPNGIARLHFGTPIVELPAFGKPHEVVDVCGAGDTVIAAFATQLLSQPTNYSPLAFANAAAASVVRKPLTATTSLSEIVEILVERF